MTPERWQRVKEVFTCAAALEPAAREHYLAEACAQDAELPSHVGALIAADASPDAVLDHSVDHYIPECDAEAPEDLGHPNIARLPDGGATSSGDPIDQYCNKHRGRAEPKP